MHMVTHQATHPLTTSQAARLLGVSKKTLLLWLQRGLVPEPLMVFRVAGRVRYRYFEDADMALLREYQLGLHPKGWRKAANAETIRQAE